MFLNFKFNFKWENFFGMWEERFHHARGTSQSWRGNRGGRETAIDTPN